jgi:hypothetical protein
MIRIVLLTALVLMVSPSAPKSRIANSPAAAKLALYCTNTGEKIEGQTKICFYNCKGDGYAMTVPSARYCPLGIER